MKKLQKGFWDYFDRWKTLYTGGHKLSWDVNWLENGFCRECRFCCGPQDSADPFPMALLPEQIKPGVEKNFYMLNADTAYLGTEGCKSHTSHGCRLDMEEKPVACGLFPIVLINGKLYLYQNCPAVIATSLAEFADFAFKAAEMLNSYTYEELNHLSIELPCEVLAAKYIDLHIQLFDATGKNLLIS